MSNIPEGVLVDDEDRQMLEKMGKWHIKSSGYCAKNSSTKMGKRKTLLMHRIILNPPDYMQVDHINGNPLDNRKCNLRIVSNQQNSFNRTKIKGYYYKKQAKKWQSQIMLNDKKIYIGLFDTEEEARNAYLEAKKIYHTI